MDQRYTAGDTYREGDSLTLIGRRASVGGSEGLADWPCMLGVVDNPPGGVWIDFIGHTVGDSQSIVVVPVTGHLLFLRYSAAGTQILVIDIRDIV